MKEAISKAMANKCPAIMGNSNDVFYNQEYETGASRCGQKATEKSFCGKQSLNECADIYKNGAPVVPIHIYKYVSTAYGSIVSHTINLRCKYNTFKDINDMA